MEFLIFNIFKPVKSIDKQINDDENSFITLSIWSNLVGIKNNLFIIDRRFPNLRWN
jgi:hypothetical protein